MIKQAIEKILSLAAPTLLEVDSQNYSSCQIYPVLKPVPASIKIRTLTGLVDYISNDIDGLFRIHIDDLGSCTLMIHVESYNSIKLLSSFIGSFVQRNIYIEAVCKPCKFSFGSWFGVEEFIVALQAQFIPTKDRDDILKIVGNLKDEHVTTFVDDGVTQNVSARVGIAKVDNVAIPNPVVLQPYRTFLEIEQPESQFIFRMRSGSDGSGQPKCALFPGDGDAWKLIAIHRIKKWLNTELPDITIIA